MSASAVSHSAAMINIRSKAAAAAAQVRGEFEGVAEDNRVLLLGRRGELDESHSQTSSLSDRLDSTGRLESTTGRLDSGSDETAGSVASDGEIARAVNLYRRERGEEEDYY